jgi:hypothetical protein
MIRRTEALVALFELIALIVVVSGVTGIVKAVLVQRGRRLPAEDRQMLERLETTMQELRDEVTAMRDDVVELQERVDFAERLLARQRESELRLGNG